MLAHACDFYRGNLLLATVIGRSGASELAPSKPLQFKRRQNDGGSDATATGRLSYQAANYISLMSHNKPIWEGPSCISEPIWCGGFGGVVNKTQRGARRGPYTVISSLHKQREKRLISL